MSKARDSESGSRVDEGSKPGGHVGEGGAFKQCFFLIPHPGSGCPLTSVPIERCTSSLLTQLSKAKGLRNYSPMALGAVGMRGVGEDGVGVELGGGYISPF